MKMIIANFKSNKTRNEFETWLDNFEEHVVSNAHIILAPPFVDLMFFSNRLMDKVKHPNTSLAVQDLSPFPAGSYTGAISTRNLEGFNVSHVILGHSERRQYFHETPNDIANKVAQTLEANITPILCVTKENLSAQARALENAHRKKVIIAYEPVANIGSGETDSLENILEVKELVEETFGSVPYIYGGSVSSESDEELLKNKSIDGFLVGGASLDAEKFVDLVKKIS